MRAAKRKLEKILGGRFGALCELVLPPGFFVFFFFLITCLPIEPSLLAITLSFSLLRSLLLKAFEDTRSETSYLTFRLININGVRRGVRTSKVPPSFSDQRSHPQKNHVQRSILTRTQVRGARGRRIKAIKKRYGIVLTLVRIISAERNLARGSWCQGRR